MRSDLDKFPTQELEAEIRRRKAESFGAPAPLLIPDFSTLREMVIEGIDHAVLNGRMDKDFFHNVYETAIEAIYGKDFWIWRNEQNW